MPPATPPPPDDEAPPDEETLPDGGAVPDQGEQSGAGDGLPDPTAGDAPETGDRVVLAAGSPRRFHPVSVDVHDEGLLLTFGRAFGRSDWEKTKQAVKASGAHFVRAIGGWLSTPEAFELDRVRGLRIVASPEAAERIEAARRHRLDRAQRLPAGVKAFRPGVLDLTPEEVQVHPGLTGSQREFVLDLRHKTARELTPRQRDWLRRIEHNHRILLERDPDYLLELYRARVAVDEERVARAVEEVAGGAGPAEHDEHDDPELAPGSGPDPDREASPADDGPGDRVRADGTPAADGGDGARTAAATATELLDDETLVAAAASWRPQIEQLRAADLKGTRIFRAEDRAEVRKLLAGEPSPWRDDLQRRLEAYLDAHPEMRLALYRAHVERDERERRRAVDAERFEAAKGDDRFALPAGFHPDRLATGDLYRHQRQGVRWLLEVRRGILAHDVGLGKTLQAIAAAADLMDRGEARRAVVVVPKARLVGWAREITRFTDRTVTVVQGTKGEREGLYGHAHRFDFVIVGYHALQKEVDALLDLGADVLIVDEAHRLKGRQTLQAKGFMRLARAPYIFFLTATPMPNRPEELHALMSFLQPELLGTFWGDFVPRYAITETIRVGRRRRPMPRIVSYRNLDELSERVRPYVFSRTAADPDVAIDLPPLHEMAIELGMAPEQERIYKRLQRDAVQTLREMHPERFGREERAGVLTKILRLEQAVISPRLLDPDYKGPSPKIGETAELLRERHEARRGGALVFCRFLDALGLLRQALERLEVPGHLIASIEGRASPGRIDEIEQAFQSGKLRFLLASDAAREGLNLQGCADLIVHLDVPWVPNVVHQRNGRIYRHGQPDPVTVLHLRMPGTVEERKVATLARKRDWIGAVLGGGGGSGDVAAALTLADFRAIVGEP